MWLYLPHLVFPPPTLTGTAFTSVLTELYNSSTPTRSPTRSLKSHVLSSSSGNNCHAVHRSLSSGASVYECTMGIFFTSSHFISQFPSTRFPLITAIRMCHFLPVHHLGMAFLAGSKAKIQQSKTNIIPLQRRCPWGNGYRRKKWTRRHEFKSWTRLIAFHISLIPLGKVWIQLFSLQLWVNSRTDWFLQPWWGNSSRRRKTVNSNLLNSA